MPSVPGAPSVILEHLEHMPDVRSHLRARFPQLFQPLESDSVSPGTPATDTVAATADSAAARAEDAEGAKIMNDSGDSSAQGTKTLPPAELFLELPAEFQLPPIVSRALGALPNLGPAVVASVAEAAALPLAVQAIIADNVHMLSDVRPHPSPPVL